MAVSGVDMSNDVVDEAHAAQIILIVRTMIRMIGFIVSS
jgi:hypothetical protein